MYNFKNLYNHIKNVSWVDIALNDYLPMLPLHFISSSIWIHVCMWLHMPMESRRQTCTSFLKSHLSTLVGFVFVLTSSLTRLEVIELARLACQWDSGVPSVLIFLMLARQHVPPCLDFQVSSVNQNNVYMLAWQAPGWMISSVPPIFIIKWMNILSEKVRESCHISK